MGQQTGLAPPSFEEERKRGPYLMRSLWVIGGGDFPRCICNILKHHYVFFIAYFNDHDFFHPFYLTKKIALTSYFDHN